MRQIDIMWDWPKLKSHLVMVVNGPWPMMSRIVVTRVPIIRLSLRWPKRRYFQISIGPFAIYWHDKGDRHLQWPHINLRAKSGGALASWPLWFVNVVWWKHEKRRE